MFDFPGIDVSIKKTSHGVAGHDLSHGSPPCPILPASFQKFICHFEVILGGPGWLAGQISGCLSIKGTGDYYYDVDRILWLGKQLERTVGIRLKSEAMINGRTFKEGYMQYSRIGLAKLKEKLGETPDQNFFK